MQKNIQTLVDNLDYDLSAMYDVDEVDIDESVVYPLIASLMNKVSYREIEEVDRGGEKKIFKAHDARSDRYVALARPLRDTQENAERFLREARICAGLEHPNIIPVYDIELDEEQRPFFTMELLKGQTLKVLLERFHSDETANLDLVQLLDIFIKVCDAVDYAHSKNVLHLDIKPENINVGDFGQVLLIDWGLAKVLNDPMSEALYGEIESFNTDYLNDMTQVGTLKGSPGFMAPEQSGVKGEKTIRTDIYSLGALLYKILTGKNHVMGDSIEIILEKTREGKKGDFNDCKKMKIPKSLEAVYWKACQLSPEERYSSVWDLKNEIQNFLRGYATDAENASFFKQISLVYHRNRMRCQIVFGFMLLILIGTSIFIQALSKSEKQALSERDKAETALSLYEKEKRGRESILAEFDESIKDFKENLGTSRDIEAHFNRLLVGSAIASSRKLDFDMALALTELAIQKNPKDYNAIAEKGFVHLIRHEFVKANQELQKCSTHSPHIYDIIRVARKFSILKANDEQRLTHEKFINLIRELPPNRSWLKSYMLIYDRQVNPSLKDHSELVKGYLSILNPKLKEQNLNFNFEIRSEGNRLTISGNSNLFFIKNLGGPEFPYRSILKTLDLKYLDLSHTSLVRLRNLRDIGLSELNVAYTPVKDFEVLSEFEIKPILHVSRSQNLSTCPEDIKIIYVD